MHYLRQLIYKLFIRTIFTESSYYNSIKIFLHSKLWFRALIMINFFNSITLQSVIKSQYRKITLNSISSVKYKVNTSCNLASNMVNEKSRIYRVARERTTRQL